MKKGDLVQGRIEKIDFPNKGIMTVDGERIVLKNTIPGQLVQAVVTKKRKGKCEGRVLEVLEKAPAEKTEGTCRHFPDCGGCIYQSLPYEEQRKIKENQVLELLHSVCPEGSFQWQGVKASPAPYAYRNKMEFSFGDAWKGGPLALGMHKRGSFYDIVTTENCRIVHPDFGKILEATREYFAERSVPFYKKLQHTGYLRHLLVRRAVKTGEILVDLVTSTQLEWILEGAEPNTDAGKEEALLEGWAHLLEELPLEGKLTGILHTQNDSLADVVQSDRTDVLYGQDYFYEELLGLRFKITPFSFFQTNSLGAEVLYDTVRSYIGETKDKVVFDLYSGTGTIAQLLAPVARSVTGVEIVPEAVKAAEENAAMNGLENCHFLAGDVLKVVDELTEKPDLIVLDPPRDGIHPKALPKIIDFGVNRIVYVSCKPTSLVRDLGPLMEAGYRVVKMCGVDMFPFTANCETVVLLSKGEIDSKKVRVEFSLEDMDMSGFQKGATYEQIKAYVLEHTGLKVSSLYISQIKRKCGLDVGHNYNLSKKEDAKVPQCPPEKEVAIREAFNYFGML